QNEEFRAPICKTQNPTSMRKAMPYCCNRVPQCGFCHFRPGINLLKTLLLSASRHPCFRPECRLSHPFGGGLALGFPLRTLKGYKRARGLPYARKGIFLGVSVQPGLGSG